MGSKNLLFCRTVKYWGPLLGSVTRQETLCFFGKLTISISVRNLASGSAIALEFPAHLHNGVDVHRELIGTRLHDLPHGYVGKRAVRRLFILAGALFAVFAGDTAVAQGATTAQNCSVPNVAVRTRPQVGGLPVRIDVSVFLIDILDIRETEEIFDADFILNLQWRDPRLSAAELGVTLEHCDIGLRNIWHPQIEIINQRNMRSDGWQHIEVDADGVVLFERRISGTLTSPMELEDYPLDSQDLVIRLSSFKYVDEDVILAVDESATGRTPVAMQAGWEIISNTSEVMPPLSIVGGSTHSRIFHKVSVHRLFSYSFWKLVVPLSLIVLMAWSVFWLDPQAYVPQVTVGTSSIFTLIAFQLSIAESLPQLSYLTNADKLVMAATLLVFLALGQAVVTSRLAQRNQVELARQLDRYGRWIYPFLYLFAVVFALW